MTNAVPRPIASSANVSAALLVGEQRISLSKVSPKWLYFSRGNSFGSGPAKVELNIDGKIHVLNVRVVDRVRPFDDGVAIQQDWVVKEQNP